MKSSLGFTALISCGFVAATPIESRYAVKETFKVPSSFRRVADAPAGQLIRLQVALSQNRFDELERRLYEGWQIGNGYLTG